MHMLGGCFRKGAPSLLGELEARVAPGASPALEMPEAKPTRMTTEGRSERTGIRSGQSGEVR